MYGPYLVLEQVAGARSSLLLSDIQVNGSGVSSGFPRSQPVYVPTSSSISVPYTSSVALSYESGAIRKFIDAGLLTASFRIGSEAWNGILATRTGWVNIGDSATLVTPLSISANVWTQLTNDGLSSTTITDYLPEGVTEIWDPATNAFVFDDRPEGCTTAP